MHRTEQKQKAHAHIDEKPNILANSAWNVATETN